MSTTATHSRRARLAAAAGLVAASAYGGAVGLAGGALSLGRSATGRLPFESPVVGGVALAFVVAVPFTVVALRAWRGRPDAGASAMFAGLLLMLWIVVELAFIRELSFFHPLFMVVGGAFAFVGHRTRSWGRDLVDPDVAQQFLARPRIALVGASAAPAKFGHVVFTALREYGYDIVPVNPRAAEVAGVPCHARIDDLPADIDAALIMVPGEAAVQAVNECAAHGIRYVWLFRGAGEGALNERTLAVCREHGLVTVPGACPLMFLPPVTGVHRLHLKVRSATGAVAHV